jgi:phage repressor protein C with HTH and peptisase S24 domain
MNMSERIAFALSTSGRTPRELSKEIGVSIARISQLKAGTGGIKAENLFALARATGCSANWLAEGVGEPKVAANVRPDHLVVANYCAELGEAAPEVGFDKAWLRRLGLSESSLRHVRLRDDTMSPAIAPDDLLLINLDQRTPQDGQVYLVQRPEGGTTIKRFLRAITGEWVIRSENDNKRHYPDERISDEDIGMLKIVGRIVWRGGKL